MNLGHGRAGHLPDYSFMRYIYMPAWGGYKEIFKDNPSEYYKAFSQMVYAMRYIRGDIPHFEKNTYDEELLKPYETEIMSILTRRQLDSCKDWEEFGKKLSGKEITPFDIKLYQEEYTNAALKEKKSTDAGRFFAAAESQKSMVTDKIFSSGNLLAGFSKRKSIPVK